MHENYNSDNYNNENTNTRQLDFSPIQLAQNNTEYMVELQSAQTFSNEFGVGFLLRNNAGHRLYYNDDFRIDSVVMRERNNPAGLQFINNGDIQEAHVSWGNSRAIGIYTFERDFFLDADLTELYTTLTFEFDVVGWYHFTEDAEPIPSDLQIMQDNRIRNSLAFQIAGGTSNIIVLASEVAVSRTEVAFNIVNLSTQSFMHGLDHRLLVYENGWKPAPIIIDSWGIPGLGIGMQGGEIIEDHFNFEWLHGVLENGRYMIMRQHAEDHMRPGAPRVQEMLMVEFIIDDNTPMNLSGDIPTATNIIVYADEITPTGLRLNITNHTTEGFSYNPPFIVQKYVYGNWENIYELAPSRHQVSTPSIDSNSFTENWAERFGKLPPGRYQLMAHFSTAGAGVIVTHKFYISQETFDSYDGDTELNPMFQQNVIVTDVTATPTGITIRWENISDRTFYTPWTGYWVERYSPEEGRDWNRLRESFDSIFSGPDVNLRQVTIEMSGGGAMTFDTTAVHPGQHVYQTINWSGELHDGQYVISLGHFHPDEPGFMYWIRPWERFTLMFSV